LQPENLQRAAATRTGIVAVLQDPIDLILGKRLPLMPLVPALSALSANVPLFPPSGLLPLGRRVGDIAGRRLGRSRRVPFRLRQLISHRRKLLLQLRNAACKLLPIFASLRPGIVHDAAILPHRPKSADSNSPPRERLPTNDDWLATICLNEPAPVTPIERALRRSSAPYRSLFSRASSVRLTKKEAAGCCASTGRPSVILRQAHTA
jgi:hypothetical protein